MATAIGIRMRVTIRKITYSPGVISQGLPIASSFCPATFSTLLGVAATIAPETFFAMGLNTRCNRGRANACSRSVGTLPTLATSATRSLTDGSLLLIKKYITRLVTLAKAQTAATIGILSPPSNLYRNYPPNEQDPDNLSNQRDADH